MVKAHTCFCGSKIMQFMHVSDLAISILDGLFQHSARHAFPVPSGKTTKMATKVGQATILFITRSDTLLFTVSGIPSVDFGNAKNSWS